MSRSSILLLPILLFLPLLPACRDSAPATDEHAHDGGGKGLPQERGGRGLGGDCLERAL